MQCSIYTIPGKYYRETSYHQFDLDRDGFQVLSVILHDAVVEKKMVEVEIGAGKLIVKNGSNIGLAEYRDGLIEWTSNYADMMQLSVAFANLATVRDTEISHIHLEPVYLVASNTVSDIVFQQQ